MTLRQLGYHAGPLLLVDTEGYWSRYAALVDSVIDEGFAEASARSLYSIVPSPAAAVLEGLQQTATTPKKPAARGSEDGAGRILGGHRVPAPVKGFGEVDKQPKDGEQRASERREEES